MVAFSRFATVILMAGLVSSATPAPASAQGSVYSVTTSLLGQPSVVERFSTTGSVNQTTIVPASQGISGAGGMVFGPGGNLYVSSRNTSDIFRVNPATGATTTYANTSLTTQGPAGMAFVGNTLYVSRFVNVQASADTGSVDRYDISGGLPVYQGVAVPGLNQPAGIGVGPTGSLFISNVGYSSPGSGSVVRYEPSSNTSSVFVANQTAGGTLVSASASRIGPDGALWVVDVVGNAIRRYHAVSGAYLGDFAANTPFLDSPSDLVFDDQGRVWVANLGNETAGLSPQNPGTPRFGTIERFDLNTGAHIDTVANTGYYAQLAFQAAVPEPGSVLAAATLGVVVLRAVRRLRG